MEDHVLKNVRVVKYEIKKTSPVYRKDKPFEATVLTNELLTTEEADADAEEADDDDVMRDADADAAAIRLEARSREHVAAGEAQIRAEYFNPHMITDLFPASGNKFLQPRGSLSGVNFKFFNVSL